MDIRTLKKHIRYTALYIDGRHFVTDTRVIEECQDFDNGFLVKIGNKQYFSEYLYQNNNLATAWGFNEIAQDEFALEENLLKMATKCPDSL